MHVSAKTTTGTQHNVTDLYKTKEHFKIVNRVNKLLTVGNLCSLVHNLTGDLHSILKTVKRSFLTILSRHVYLRCGLLIRSIQIRHLNLLEELIVNKRVL